MDVPRAGVVERRRRRAIWAAVAGGAVVLVVVVFAARLEPAAPSVAREEVFVDTVQRGELVRSVRGPGTLVPVTTRWIAAGADGRVVRVHALPGTAVEPDTVLVTLENPTLAQSLRNAELTHSAAESLLVDREVRLRRELLSMRSQVASVEAEARQAALDAEADAEIHSLGIIGRIELEDSEATARELAERAGRERERLRLAEEAGGAELDGARANVSRLRASLDHLSGRMKSWLTVRAGIPGVLQQVSVEAGQQVTLGTNLARVSDPTRLKAELRVAEIQARDVEVGQPASVDTRGGIIAGRVSRVDPAVSDGAVLVDVEIPGDLPRGARSDLSVDGLIEIERIPDALYVGRPAFGAEGEEVELFRLTGDGSHGERIPVRLGRTSVGAVEILAGLEAGDAVILSDTSAWEGHRRIRLR